MSAMMLRRPGRAPASVLGVVLVGTLLAVPPAPAVAAAPEPLRGQVEHVDADGGEVRGTAPAGAEARAADLPDPVWPGASSARVVLRDSGVARAGGAPVTVARASASLPSDLTVEVLDRSRVPAAWRDGVVLRVGGARGATASGAATVSVDYRGFRHAYGGGWSDRLRLWQLPQCALTTPGEPRCAPRELPSVNDPAVGTVTADATIVPIGGTGAATTRAELAGDVAVTTTAGTLFAVAAVASGPSGDFGATSLAPSSIWSAGGNSGAFTWAYDIATPPVHAGGSPALSVTYNSSSVDGRSSATNNQPSWLGEGFELGIGYVERRYVGCADDTDGGANNGESTRTGDLCWRNDNAVLNLNGATTELIYEAGRGWHGRAENGSTIEKTGEYWKVTGTDGTEYYFGRNTLPGHAGTTESAWTVPVYGNHAGEPCHRAAFADSMCDQVYRWNLDYVVDVRGNTRSYWYAKELNQYATRATATTPVDYVRGGTLTRIDYGTWDRGAADRSVTPVARVVLDSADRCVTASCGTHDAQNWPDVPWDQECAVSAATCPDVNQPTFWSTKRLSKITTRLWDTTKATPGWQDVASWTFTHSFPSPGDGGSAGLWLSSIVRTGLVGTAIEMPPVTFLHEPLPNRVLTAHNTTNSWQRLSKVVSETGATTHVRYSLPQCTASNLPASAAGNGMRCYPVIGPDPSAPTRDITEWWHKYVVESVTETDVQLTGGVQSPQKVTTYTYEGAPAWHYADDDGLIQAKRKTWSQYRGYAAVTTRVGAGDARTLSRTTYLRGMHGDRASASGGTRTVTVGASLGDETVHDEDAFAGMTRESVVYNGTLDRPVSKTVSVPWQSPPTASRTINGDTVSARHVKTQTTYTGVALGVAGERGWRTGRDHTTFDDVYGLVTSAQSDGDLGVTGDEDCTTYTYSRNTAKNLVGLYKRVTRTALSCGTAPATIDDVISDTRTYYDGAAGVDAVPAYGSATRTEVLKNWTKAGGTEWEDAGQTGYDAFGRTVRTTDVRGGVTTTAYTPASGGPVTKVTTTNPLGWTTTIDTAPYWGVPAVTTDPNNRVETREYDALGRVARTWDAGWTKAAQPNSPQVRYTYVYAPNRDAYPYVKTERLHAGRAYTATFEILDGFLRTRQTQTAARDGSGNRVLTDTHYDEYGRVSTTYQQHVEPGTASGVYWYEPQWSVPAVNRTVYDLAGRTTDTILLAGDGVTNLVEKWRTHVTDEGDRTLTTPPAGGTPTTALRDLRDRTTELRQHTTAAGVAGDYRATSYAYDRRDLLVRVTDAGGNEWTYTYDAKGRELSRRDPDSGTSLTTYNAFGDVETTTNGAGETLWRGYDSLGRQTQLRDDSATGALRAGWTFDTLYSGQVVRGQLTQTVRYDNSRDPATTAEYRWQVRVFDLRYNVTSANYVIPAVETGLAGTWVVGVGYSPYDGSRVSTSYPPAGGMTTELVETEFHAGNGLPNALRTNLIDVDSYVVNQQYTAYGEPTFHRRKTKYGAYVEDNTLYDTATRRVTGTTVRPESAAGTVANTSYGYDPAGNIVSVADAPAVGTADTQCFGYDTMRQLTSAWTPGSGTGCETAPSVANLGGAAPYWTDWTIDAIGNRTKEVGHTAAGDVSTTYAVPAAGATAVRPHAVTGTTRTAPGASPVTQAYAYDGAGNTVTRPGQTLTWDAEGRLVKTVEGTATHTDVYDAGGVRLIRRDPTGATLYLPGMEVRRATGATSSTATRYYEFAGKIVASRTGSNTNGSLTWLYSDHQGTQNLTVAAAGQAVTSRRQTPYGTARGAAVAWPNQKGFVGGDGDPTGLVHIGARDYDAVLGRFLSADPVMDLRDPQQWNAYAYAHNSPVTFSDPSGLRDCDYADCDGHGNSKNLDDNHDGTPDPPKPGGGKPGGGRKTNDGRGGGDRQRPPAPDYSLTCTKDACTQSQDEEELYSWLVAESYRYQEGMPPNVRAQLADVCLQINCSTLGKAQLAWCYRNHEVCANAMLAAVATQGAAQQLTAGASDHGTMSLGQTNAIRHASWMALVVTDYGLTEEQALTLGVAHEMDGTGENAWGSGESKIDLHNNLVGVKLGQNIRNSEYYQERANQALVIDQLIIAARSDGCGQCLYVYK
ncbi:MULTISPECIES: RHS repeat domain-containing protein [Catenuloplanes]|uniref:RHS repeat-associated protein n=1 Tax=Catenuloplanes niger TaxID=587534 RepID=A0AAE4CPK8_9ACTN|nr:RHS repeat-associated core domain-containing protein [Catenuloplanes niger]MDR7320050.1 RHS repeat-associated protein [Catenuloplanes niger]